MFIFMNKHPKHLSIKKRVFHGKIIIILSICLLFILLGGAGFVLYLIKTLPDPTQISDITITQSTKIYDRTGQTLLYDVHGEEKRTVINSEDMGQAIKDAVVAAEDNDFYNHPGINIGAIIRAFIQDVIHGSAVQGGSTITQQLVKNAFLTDDKTLIRKIKEALLAIQMEQHFSKEEILTMYLNQIPFGSNSYGIEAAANTFFNKHAKDLTVAQAALLASLIQAPSYYSPYGTHLTELLNRQKYVIQKMYSLGLINSSQENSALKEALVFAPPVKNLIAPHFVLEVKNQLEKMYGAGQIDRLGLKVYTSLDVNLQQEAEQIVKEQAQFNQQNYKAANAAMVVEDPKTGQILALVGSADYFAPATPSGCIPGQTCQFEGNFDVATQGLRQPGSSFKPIAYAEAFIKGYTPNTILMDVPINFAEPGSTPYTPKDYDLKFRGPVTMRSALAQSLNVPSVETLYLAGIDDTIKLANAMGISTINSNSQCGLSLVLGGCEVKLIEMVQAYSVFANDGTGVPYSFIQKITDASGNVLYQSQSSPQQVISSQIAREISDVLSDNTARTPMFGANSSLYFKGVPVAAKTGTTNNNRDAWVIGYTPEITVGVWVGNNNGDPMTKEGAGISAAGPIFHRFLEYALQTIPHTAFIPPDPINSTKPVLNGIAWPTVTVSIDKRTGQPANSSTPPDQVEQETITQKHTILYYVQKDNPQGPPPSDPASDPQYNNWESGLQQWLQTNPIP